MTRSQRRWTVAGAALLLLAGLVLAFDSNWLKGPIERAVSERMGRPFEIRGEFDIDPGLHPRFLMADVRLANPDWAAEPDTLRVQRAEFTLALLPLLRGRVVLPDVRLSQPLVALERDADGRNTWSIPPGTPKDEKDPGEPPVIGRIAIEDGLILFTDAVLKADVRLEIGTTRLADGQPGVEFRAGGKYQGHAVSAAGRGGAILGLAETTEPYPFEAEFRVGPTHGTVAGSVTGMAQAADLRLDLAGDSLADLYAITGVSFPPSPPYRLRGRLLREGKGMRFEDFDGRVGDSDMRGTLAVNYGGVRPRMDADLRSDVLDLDDFGGLVGGGPEVGPGETASAQQRREAARRAASPTLLPDTPIPLARLRAMDADVKFSGGEIRGRAPVRDLQTHAVLKDGVLTLKPMNFGLADGAIVSTVVIDARGSRGAVDADIEARRIDMRKLFPGNQTIARAAGIAGGHLVFKGTGNSTAEILGSADGRFGLAMSGGRVSNLLLEVAGLDVAEALRFLFRGDKTVKVRCAVADATIKDGLMQSRSVVLDTTDTNVKIDGTVDLRKEELDLTMHPMPKDYSPLTLRSPIHLKGTFKDPAIRLDEKLLTRGGIAAILGAVAAPVVALVGLIDTGPGDNADCEQLIAAVRRHAGPQAAPTVSPDAPATPAAAPAR